MVDAVHEYKLESQLVHYGLAADPGWGYEETGLFSVMPNPLPLSPPQCLGGSFGSIWNNLGWCDGHVVSLEIMNDLFVSWLRVHKVHKVHKRTSAITSGQTISRLDSS